MDITEEHVITTASTSTGNGKTGIEEEEEEPTRIETLIGKQFSSANDDLTNESNVDEMKIVEEDLGGMNEKDDLPSSTKEIIAENSIELAKSDKNLAMEVDTEMEESKDTEGDGIKQTESDVTSTALHTDPAESVLDCEEENDPNDPVKKTTDVSEKPAGELETEESTMAATSNADTPIELTQNVSEALQKNVGIPDEVKSAVTDAETEIDKSLDISEESDAHSNIKTKEPQENDAIERPLNSSNETEKTLTAEHTNVIEIDDEPQVPTKNNENDANEKPLVSLNETAENSNVIEIDDEPQVLTKNNENDANEKPLNPSNETEKTSETAENTNVIEIDDEPQVLTKDNKNENVIEKPLNSSNETAKPLTGEKPNAKENNDETQDLAKNDEKVSDQPIEKKVENDPNSDDDVQFEKPNIMVITIDDDDDDDDDQHGSANINTDKNESTCMENVESAKLQENTTEKLDVMDVDVATTVEKLATEDVEMKETATTVDKSEKLVQDTDTNTLLVETTKAPSPTPENNEKDSTDDDTSGEVYYNKECVNYECARKHKQFFRAPLFALSYYKIAKKKFKPQFICAECYDQALEMYEEFSSLLAAKQPLLLKDIVGGRQEFVEIIDSSDEEDEDDKTDKAKDNKYFSKDDIKLIEDELENSIRKVLGRVEIQNQLTWSKTILASRAKALEEETNYIDAELRSLQKKADHMHVTLYQCPKIKVRQLQPLDLNTGRPFATADVDVALPPIGEIQRPSIKINEIYYAVKNKAIASWVPCRVVEQVEGLLIMKNITHYKIRFLKSQYQPFKTVSVKHLAYYEPPSVRLPIGSRVIAYFDATSLSRGKEKMMIQSAFYPGIIAEPLKPNNKYRYLIFYDDGYTQYVHHKDVRLVCNVSDNVWEDVHPGSRDFIQKYLTQYSINRPMVQTQKGQSMTTESNGKWIYARVVDIDCSLIQMQFEGPKSHTEWIYRGSMRLGPVFKEHQKTMQKTTMPISRLPRRTEPFIRYTEDEEATTTQQQQQRQLQQQQNEPRAVAKKSVSRQESQNNTSQQFTPVPPVVRHLNNSTIYLEDENKPKGKVVYYTAKRNLPPKTYKPHTCSPACLYKITHNLSAYSPLSKPLLSGWERLIIRQKIKKVVTYRGPCGKISRNMKELRNYLRATNNVLNVENFDFSPETNCLAEYVIESAIVQKRDISNGQEKMAIPLVNYYDNTMPPECKYSAQRIPTEGVELIVDEEFLVGCDCEDDCSDKTKCSCWQLTYAGAKYGNPNTPIEEIGYQYKRLYEHVPTGIYECNSRCKCKSNCLNRVVQHSLEMKLQVFKTSNRGWGLRCINDVPRGSFMCVYAGHLLTEAKANEGGLDAGDEYFAELDYIEVAEQIKEGYESDIGSPEPEEEDDLYDQEDHDDEFTPSKPHNTRSKAKLQKSTRGSSSAQGIDEDSQERQMINFNPNAIMDENSMRESSIRKLFGKDEACYVMDAKVTGNLGRYFNHSCSPNLFVQNVFVDTHDLRFPWVAFFALTHIRAGTELTWNYNYEVGVVPGKVLYCQCGAPNCRLRLL